MIPELPNMSAVRKSRTGKKNVDASQQETHYLNIALCRRCPLREGCYKNGAKSKTCSTSLKSKKHSEQLDYERTDELM